MSASSLIVSKRKQVSRNKPENFLVAILPDNRREYISSLFPTSSPGQYRFDYQGQNFQLVYDDAKQVHVEPA